MIDFDDLEERDVNVQVTSALEGCPLPEALLKGISWLERGEHNDTFAGSETNGGPADVPRQKLSREQVRVLGPRGSLAVLVPYRDDAKKSRSKQLKRFVHHFRVNLLHVVPNHVQVKVVILEQTEKGKFNRGKLLNIGALWCRAFLYDDVILCPHDVDLLPDPSLMPYYCHYHRGECVHIGWIQRKYDYAHFFGGICAIPMMDFFDVGGFPNNFWGWGREDDVLHGRLRLLLRANVLLPEDTQGLRCLDEHDVPHTNSPRSQSDNLITVSHLHGSDNIFDPADFKVLDAEEKQWLCHLLLDLDPRWQMVPDGKHGISAQMVDELLPADTS